MKQDQSASWAAMAAIFVGTCLYGMATQGEKDAVLLFGGLLIAAPFALALALLFWHGLRALIRGE